MLFLVDWSQRNQTSSTIQIDIQQQKCCIFCSSSCSSRYLAAVLRENNLLLSILSFLFWKESHQLHFQCREHEFLDRKALMCHIHFYWPFSCPFMLFSASFPTTGRFRKHWTMICVCFFLNIDNPCRSGADSWSSVYELRAEESICFRQI
jgi:hypothetical protein